MIKNVHGFFILIQTIAWEGCGSSANSALNSYADNPGSSPGECALFYQTLPAFHPVWTYWEIIPFRCNVECKK